MQINLNLGEEIEIPKPPVKKKRGRQIDFCPDNCTIVDIETTGLAPYRDEIIEISAIRVRGGLAGKTFSSLIKIEGSLNHFIINLTGITPDMLKDAPDIKTVLKDFLEFVQDDIIVGHNIKFDLGFIQQNLKVHLDEVLPNDFSDTVALSRKTYKLNSYKLSNIAKHLNIDTRGAHRGLKDCQMTYQILCDIKKRNQTKGL